MLPQPSVRFFYESSGILFVGGFLAFSLLAASAQVGSVVVFLGIFFRLTPRVTMINDSLYQARVLLPWYDSWRRVYDTALRSARPSTGTLRKPGFEVVEARDVNFSYPTGRQVLSDVSVELRRGRCVALVGESGSGKTTLMDLFVGLLDPESGSLTVDGTPMSEIDRGWWHRQLGLVLQDSTIFSTTVLENVALGDDEPDRDRALESLRLAAARDFVLAMPDGLDTHVGERGSKLSGGQRQRLALARALYRDPGLLCLDEATAALDGDSEALILEAVSRIKRDRAVLLASHRVTTLAIADEIVVFDAGRIVERGSWDELMATPTRFRRLVESQS
jgi:ABC-type multidrug transport system fused ATPase/permease subunit